MEMKDHDYVAGLEAKVAELRSFERGYAKPHVWNFIAKTLRENYPMERSITDGDLVAKMEARRAVEDIALDFARRFKAEDGFDPVKFLDQCSPDPDLHPFSELWEE